MSYFHADIAELAGYTPGEQPQSGGFVKLNTNENPYPPSPRVLEAISRVAADRLHLYPDPLATRFREAAGQVLGVPPDWLVACNGSDDALTILTRACLSAGDLMIAPTPSYPLYRVLARIQGCQFAERPFTSSWDLPDDFCAGGRLSFIPNPNSPTGTMVAPSRLLDLADKASSLVVVDEAYADFADTNCLSLVRECERMVVTRSMSKSYALAGIRFGFVVAQPVVTQTLLKVKDSYNCDALAIAAATAAIADQAYYRGVLDRIRATRDRLERGLAGLGFDVTRSHTNFVWARRREPVEPVYHALKERRILVRHLVYPGYGDGLRITVGTDPQIDQLLSELPRVLGVL